MTSRGDPRVLLAMNIVLSAAFAAVVLWGLEYLDAYRFTFVNFAALTLALVVLTHVVTQ
ncbi:hypothetical protein ACFQPA_13305 [Halomarina halobia]|uniref:DUF8107 domain-containing protein n=1 Tax=Halomarina halobia TaxID=3033386 RepID=A0ABD6A8M7_9EURY|nr:hypothetical protein [Halomarina sp. PSR21]